MIHLGGQRKLFNKRIMFYFSLVDCEIGSIITIIVSTHESNNTFNRIETWEVPKLFKDNYKPPYVAVKPLTRTYQT
mgnify:CR=1 FL=1